MRGLPNIAFAILLEREEVIVLDARAASRAGISAFYEFLREDENIALSLFIAFSCAYRRDQNLHMPREEKNTLI